MSVIVTVNPKEKLETVVARLRRSKFRIAEVMDRLHIVTIAGDRKTAARVKQVPGVIAAEADSVVSLDPREVPKMGAGWPSSADRTVTPPVTGSSWRSPAWDND
jgi:hypothetical protein